MKPMNVKELVERMTLEEKIEMCSGVDFWHLKGIEAGDSLHHGQRRPSRPAQAGG